MGQAPEVQASHRRILESSAEKRLEPSLDWMIGIVTMKATLELRRALSPPKPGPQNTGIYLKAEHVEGLAFAHLMVLEVSNRPVARFLK